jgi:hypothetical protein
VAEELPNPPEPLPKINRRDLLSSAPAMEDLDSQNDVYRILRAGNPTLVMKMEQKASMRIAAKIGASLHDGF